jgi:hypothetical protein
MYMKKFAGQSFLRKIISGHLLKQSQANGHNSHSHD